MLDVFQRRFGVGDAALDWFASYLVVRTQQVVTGTDSSSVCQLLIGTPQGSVLGPKCFVTYAEDVTEIFQQHGIPHLLFADDMQGIRRSKPSRVNAVATKLTACVSAVSNWCAASSSTPRRPRSRGLVQQQISTDFHWPTNTSKSDLTMYRRPVLSATSASSSTLN